jgi:hypothetical protein
MWLQLAAALLLLRDSSRCRFSAWHAMLSLDQLAKL